MKATREMRIGMMTRNIARIGELIATVVLLPISLVELAIKKYKKVQRSKIEWSDEKTTEILSYYVFRKGKWIKEENTLHFFDNGFGWSDNGRRYIKRKDRAYWDKYIGFCGGDIRKYLIDKFEIPGFEKVVDKYIYIDQKTTIDFVQIEK